MRGTAAALVLVMAVSGCVAGDRAPEDAAGASENGELRAARGRIARLEAELAQTQATEDAEGSSPVTQWQRQRAPRRFQAAGPGFRHADELLFSLADHLVDLRSEDAGVSVTLRARDDEGNVVGAIVLDGYLDDSVRGHEYRASLRREGDVWHMATLMARQLCRRGGGRDACL